MYQTALVPATTLSRRAGPVCMIRLAMRPAKSFWKKAQLWRTTCQWLCQRIRLVRPGAIAWLVMSACSSSAEGRSTSSTTAMPMSLGQSSRSNSPGAWVETRVTTRPMKTGMLASSSATTKPAMNSATTRRPAWRA